MPTALLCCLCALALSLPAREQNGSAPTKLYSYAMIPSRANEDDGLLSSAQKGCRTSGHTECRLDG
jgi:hypothetical protein